jgi:hypothetical protein
MAGAITHSTTAAMGQKMKNHGQNFVIARTLQIPVRLRRTDELCGATTI